MESFSKGSFCCALFLLEYWHGTRLGWTPIFSAKQLSAKNSSQYSLGSKESSFLGSLGTLLWEAFEPCNTRWNPFLAASDWWKIRGVEILGGERIPGPRIPSAKLFLVLFLYGLISWHYSFEACSLLVMWGEREREERVRDLERIRLHWFYYFRFI